MAHRNRWDDGLPNLNMVIFHGKLLNNQMVVFMDRTRSGDSKHLQKACILNQPVYKGVLNGTCLWDKLCIGYCKLQDFKLGTIMRICNGDIM